MNIVFQFLGYVFCFWLVWRVFDLITHRVVKSAPKFSNCNYCDRRDKDIESLNELVKQMEDEVVAAQNMVHENRNLRGEIDKLKKHIETLNERLKDYHYQTKQEQAVAFLNAASKEQLVSVYGIGPTYADKIIEGRPYTKFQDVRRVVTNNMFIQLEVHTGLRERNWRRLGYKRSVPG